MKYFTIVLLSLATLFDDKLNKLQSLECAPVRSNHGYTNGLYHANYCWERLEKIVSTDVLQQFERGDNNYT